LGRSPALPRPAKVKGTPPQFVDSRRGEGKGFARSTSASGKKKKRRKSWTNFVFLPQGGGKKKRQKGNLDGRMGNGSR